MSSGIYAHPDLYAAFHQLEPELVDAALDWARRAVRPAKAGPRRRRPPGTGLKHVHRVYEPGCGPGQWLAVFARMGCQVFGLDMEPAMARSAQLAVQRATVYAGDMSAPPSELLEEATAEPFDLALNLHGTAGHLPSLEAVERHLRSVWLMLRPGGVYLWGLTVRSGRKSSEPMVLGEYGPRPVAGGGMASLRSLSLGAAAGSPYERIQHLMMTFGVKDAGPLIAETYDLVTFPLPWVKRALRHTGPWQLVEARSMLADGFPRIRLGPESSDVTLVLRK
jgi:SAM-dependent methyltransferase